MTADSEYRVRFVREENGPRRRVRHGAITLHAVVEKRTPNGRVRDKTRLGSIDLEALEYDLVKDRDDFWRVTDLYLGLFEIPTDEADVICQYLSRVVRPVTESEAASHYDCGGGLR
jgi:hypothetical protein